MTSPYNEKINKLNTALENVYLKKTDLVDELGDILDEMIASETLITVNISDISNFGTGIYISALLLKNYKTNELYLYWSYGDDGEIIFNNGTASFQMPYELSFKDAMFEIISSAYGESFQDDFYLYELEDSDNDNIINVSMNNLPNSPSNE